MTRLFAVLYLTAIALTACSDPQHGATHFGRTIGWLISVAAFLMLCVAADFVVRRRTQGPHS